MPAVRGSAIIGYIEHIDERLIRGWAWDTTKPDTRLCLNVFVDGIFSGCARTGQFRGDLAENGIGDGRHAFTFHLPEFLAGRIVRPDTVEIVTIGSFPTQLGKIIQHRKMSDAEPQSVERDAKSFFAPLLDLLSTAPPADIARVPGDRRQIDKLLGPAAAGPTSAFAEHIHFKYAAGPSLSEGSAFLRWYVEDYGIEKGASRVPLSIAEIEALQALGLSPCRRLSDHYRWAVHEARRLHLEDCLIEPASKAALRQVPLATRLHAFPLSRFMRMLRAENALIARHNGLSAESRITIYTLIMLFALTETHYLVYMPGRWLSTMLDEADSVSLFERTQRQLLGGNSFVTAKIFTERASGRTFDLAKQSFETGYATGRIRYGRSVVRDKDRPDVQLIGPFRRSLGLSESCRRFAVALMSTDYLVNFVDFDTGPQSAAVASDICVSSIKAARINILHLNADEVPEAIAYLPDCFSRSHTILVPYLELNRPSRVHALGLSLIDEIWAPTKFIESAFERCGKSVTHVGMGTDDRESPSREEGEALLRRLGIATTGFIFLTTADALSWVQRKNVLGAIDAFQAAFSTPDITLVVKARNIDRTSSESQKDVWTLVRDRCNSDARITLIDQHLSTEDHRGLLSAIDCLISLHRAEGLGLDILDALARGTPVLATAYSGNMDFCDSETAWLVDYDLRPVAPEDYAYVEEGHVWAEPRIASAVQALRDVVHDTERRAARIEAGRRKVREHMSPAAFSGRIASLIAKILEAPSVT